MINVVCQKFTWTFLRVSNKFSHQHLQENWVEKDSHPNPADTSTVQSEDEKKISVYSIEKTEEILQAELEQDETQETEGKRNHVKWFSQVYLW